MSKSTYKKVKKTVTLAEFKAWLEGVEELQPDTWTPTAEQWKLIRNKINMIVADVEGRVIRSVGDAQAESAGTPSAPARPGRNPIFDMLAPNSPSSIPEGGEVIQASSLIPRQAHQVVIEPPGGLLNNRSADGKLRTPDIDTSNGQYSSSLV